MLKLNIKQVCAIRDIATPLKALTQAGISPQVAKRYLSGANKPHIQIAHLEAMCKLLNCTPNDLFIWQPGKADVNIKDTHALKELLPKTMAYPHDKLGTMSMEELRKFLGGAGQ